MVRWPRRWAHPITVKFPRPTLTSISPNQVAQGYSGPLTLTALGGQFFPQSVVDWNGSALPTTYVSAGTLTATIPAGGTPLGNPGGGASNANCLGGSLT